ncbi:amidohydrolase [Pseudonocardia xinjiangensis]|uniref:Amidohydrolase n=2 Tax=Pseudonocardia xinjiangensis TaxID=75289 RepID=A0ABX1RT87_9PSEU|nr:amidohydrolase [Pseudonocardia xinjiangensis]
MRIDMHAHYFPTEYLDKLEACGSGFTAIARGLGAGDDPGEIDKRLALMDAAGVDMQLLSATPQLPVFDRPGDAIDSAKLANDLYADLISRYPRRFAGLATTPLPHGEAAAEELSRAMDELGLHGASIGTEVAYRTLGDRSFEPLWSELDRRNAILYIHASGQDAASPLIADHGLRWVVGAPFEDTIGLLHLMAAGVVRRHPNIKFLVAHLGGPLPFLAQRIDDNRPYWQEGFPERPTQAWRKMWWDAANFHGPALRCAVDTFGADRIVLGSDFPYVQGDLYLRARTYIEEAGLSATSVEGILERNAAALLGL